MHKNRGSPVLYHLQLGLSLLFTYHPWPSPGYTPADTEERGQLSGDYQKSEREKKLPSTFGGILPPELNPREGWVGNPKLTVYTAGFCQNKKANMPTDRIIRTCQPALFLLHHQKLSFRWLRHMHKNRGSPVLYHLQLGLSLLFTYHPWPSPGYTPADTEERGQLSGDYQKSEREKSYLPRAPFWPLADSTCARCFMCCFCSGVKDR